MTEDPWWFWLVAPVGILLLVALLAIGWRVLRHLGMIEDPGGRGRLARARVGFYDPAPEDVVERAA